MCNCVADLDEKLKEYNTAFDKVVYFEKPDMLMKSTIQIAMKKISPRGSRPIRLFMSYCPFCGEKLEITDEEPA